MKRHYPDIALHVSTLLLPAPGVALESWAVIACDQHTSEPEYWEQTRRLVGDGASALNLVLPEARLGRGDRGAAIAAINDCMRRYLDDGVLVPCSPGFMLVEQGVGRASPRRGLVVALDLESFDYREGAEGLIRSTEGTDPGRLPARIEVRRDAPLETPHILVLIDDPGGTVIEPLFRRGLELAYDFETMQSKVTGFRDYQREAAPYRDPVRRAADNPWPTWPFIYRVDYGHQEAAAKFNRDPRAYRTSAVEFRAATPGKLGALIAANFDLVDGRFQKLEGTERTWEADLVLLAMGFRGPEPYIASPLDLELDSRTNYQAEKGHYRTNHPKVFAAGDCRSRQSLVVRAINEGREAAREIDRVLMGATELP